MSVLLEFLSEDDHSHHHHRHEDAAAHGGESGTEQAQLRERSHAIDEHPVAEDVQYVAANHHPHRHLGMRDAIEELFHRIEDADEEYRDEVDDEVRTHEREQFLWLSDMVEVEVQDDHRQGEDAAHHHVGDE